MLDGLHVGCAFFKATVVVTQDGSTAHPSKNHYDSDVSLFL